MNQHNPSPEYAQLPDDLSLHILSPADLPHPNAFKKRNPVTLQLGLNNVVFGDKAYRELRRQERHLFNIFLLLRGAGISWTDLHAHELNKRTPRPLNKSAYYTNLRALEHKLFDATGQDLIYRSPTTKTVGLHPACTFVDARPRILKKMHKKETIQTEEEPTTSMRPRQAAITAITNTYGHHSRCTELLRQYQTKSSLHEFWVRVPTHDEMYHLFVALNKGIEIMLDFAAPHWQPSKSQEQTLIEAAAAHAVIFYGNQGWARIVAGKHAPWIDFDDRLQMANLGIANAIEYYNPERGYTFSTFATRCILSHFTKGRVKERPIAIPVGDEAVYRQIIIENGHFWSAHGRQATNEELSAATDVPLAKVTNLLLHARAHLPSLNTPLREDGTELGEILPAKPAYEVNEAARDRVEQMFALPTLTTQEKLVLSLHFGVYVPELANEVILPLDGAAQRYADCFYSLSARDIREDILITGALGISRRTFFGAIKSATAKLQASGL